MDLLEADADENFATKEHDAFPGEGNREFSKNTIPAFVTWDREYISLGLFEISESEEGEITFVVADADSYNYTNVATAMEPLSYEVKDNLIYNHLGELKVYRPDGLPAGEAVGESVLSLAPGIYIITKERTTNKIIIR